VRIANPIYDSVFKHLMENQEIASGLLSRLMGVEVVSLEPRAQEITQFSAQTLASEKRTVRIFRVDFHAVVRLVDGSEQRVLIEIQKAHSSDVLERFRHYLGSHYAQPADVAEPMPIIAIYLLGFVVNPALPKVVKVRRKLLNGVTDGELPEGTKERFLEMLTHDAVVVQIPLLDDNDETGIERALALFDQRHTDRENPHYLKIEETNATPDPLVEKMVRTLLSVVSDDETRRQMRLEDELEKIFASRAKSEAATLEALRQREDALQQKEEERRQKEEERRQKEEERQQKEEERRQKEEALRQKEEALKRIEELEAKLRERE
jgi:hypothetical protein